MPPLQTPPDEATQEAPQRGHRSGRYGDMEQHELIMLLDEVDVERTRARFREAVYISIIVWLVLGWVIVYGPRYLWHAPVIVSAPDNQRQSTMTYLDTPPDLKQQLKRTKPAPAISTQSTESQSPKPAPQTQPTPRAGTPQPPAQRPSPAPQQQQAAPQPQQQAPPPQQTARNTPPTPQPVQPKPSQPIVDAPAPNAPSSNRPNFGQGQQSAAQAIQQAAKGARSGGGESGDYGTTGRGQQGGAKAGYQILSDTQGVDFAKYIQRLLGDVKRNWLPLIPEECRPPLNKQGITGVRFTIMPDGKISAMHLDYSTHDVAIDRAAWGSITGLGAAQPLPKEFHGPNLELRIEFRVNKDNPDAQ